MRKFMMVFILSFMIGAVLLVAACTKEPVKTGDSMIDFIKNEKLANFPSTLIGNAFDSYKHAKQKSWNKTLYPGGQIAVDFIGWFGPGALSDKDIKDGITDKGIDVTFVVETNGSFYVFMVTRLETRSEGKIQRFPLNDINGILEKIYANKKIDF